MATVVITGASAGVGVGFPTVKTIVGEKLAPALVDRYLARTGAKHRGLVALAALGAAAAAALGISAIRT